MKRIILVLSMIFFLGCSQLSAVYDPEISHTLIEEGLLDLLTEQEKVDGLKGKASEAIFIDNPTHGRVGDGLQAILGGRGNKKMVENISALIQAHPEKIYISRNSTVLIKAIQELGKTAEGKEALKKSRFLFIDSFLFNNKEEIETLSRQYGFHYACPQVKK